MTIRPFNLWNLNAQRNIENASKRTIVRVGIPDSVKYGNGIKVSDVARAQEFGDGNIPPRPFVRNAKAAKVGEWKETAREELTKVVKGAKTNVEALAEVGEKVKHDVVQSLDLLMSPPLSERTVAAKRRKRRSNPTKPLIDSGKMRNSFKVEVNGE